MAQFAPPSDFQITYELLRSIEQEWSCQLETEISSRPEAAVFRVRMRDTGELAVVKLARDFPKLAREARCLENFGDLAVRILDMSAPHHAVLMEDLDPGRTLQEFAEEGEDNKATRILRAILINLKDGEFDTEGFPDLYSCLEDFDLLKDRLSERVVSKTQKLFVELFKRYPERKLLHGDLHHGNVIESAKGWQIVDAKGWRGPALFEVGALMRNPEELFIRTEDISLPIERRIALLAGPDYFERKELIEGALCMTLLSMAWNLEDHGRIPKQDELIAEYLESRI